jgi:hypothetical protein
MNGNLSVVYLYILQRILYKFLLTFKDLTRQRLKKKMGITKLLS